MEDSGGFCIMTHMEIKELASFDIKPSLFHSIE